MHNGSWNGANTILLHVRANVKSYTFMFNNLCCNIKIPLYNFDQLY